MRLLSGEESRPLKAAEVVVVDPRVDHRGVESGARIGELSSLQCRDVDLQRNEILIDGEMQRGSWLSGSSRWVTCSFGSARLLTP